MNAVELKTIKFRVGDKELELTEDEARGLKAQLDALFGGKEFVPCPYPVFPPAATPYPIWWERPTTTPLSPPGFPTITCGGSCG